MGGFGSWGEVQEQYLEYLSWPRDVDTGMRAGFPGRDLWSSVSLAQEGVGREWGVGTLP